VFDPQRGVVALPAALGGSPMSWEGIEPHLAAADGWVKHIGVVLDEGSVTETDLMRRLAEDPAACADASHHDAGAAHHAMPYGQVPGRGATR